MPKVPGGITSPPAQSYQPYDATDGEDGPSQVGPVDVYDANASAPFRGNPWEKVADGGACGGDGRSTGQWPGNGDSSDGGWQQT